MPINVKLTCGVILLAVLRLQVASANAAQPISDDTIRSLQQDLANAIDDAFVVVDSNVQFEPTFRNRYWLATIEAKKAGKFTLQVDLKHDAKDIKQARDEQYKFELTIAQKGTSRLVSRTSTRAWCSPLACAGDRLVIPVRFNANDRDHRFSIRSESILKQTTVEEYLTAKDKYTKRIDVKAVKLRNGASDELELIGGRTNRFSNASKTVWYHDLEAVFRATKAGKCNVKAYYAWEAGPGRASEFGLDIRGKDQPVTVTVGYWHLFWNEDGQQSERGAMTVGERVTALRVGDTLWLSSPESPGSKSDGAFAFPTLMIEKHPFEVTKPIFVDSLPDDKKVLD